MELVKTSLCDVLLTLRIRLSECFGGRGREGDYPAGLEVQLKTCGADRSRTDDIQLAKLALYQLSYSPNKRVAEKRVGLDGFEPSTSRLSGVRSKPAEL